MKELPRLIWREQICNYPGNIQRKCENIWFSHELIFPPGRDCPAAAALPYSARIEISAVCGVGDCYAGQSAQLTPAAPEQNVNQHTYGRQGGAGSQKTTD